MARIDTTIGIKPPNQTEGWIYGFFNAINRLYQALAIAFNGNISFGDGINADNINGVWVPVHTVMGNNTINHNLGRIPVGYLMVKSDAVEFLSFVSSTTTQIVLSGLAGGANVLLFIF